MSTTSPAPGGNIGFELWDGPTPAFLTPAGPSPLSIEERFRAFNDANPWVLAALVKLARDMKANGQQHCGIKMLFEVLRWQWTRSTVSDDRFKLNNSFTSRFACEVMAQNDDLAGFFDLRELKAA